MSQFGTSQCHAERSVLLWSVHSQAADDYNDNASAFHGERVDFQLLRYIECHGKPIAFYSDKASVFCSVKAHETGSSVTHFGLAMYELNIDTLCANSSSAKGRVERAHLR